MDFADFILQHQGDDLPRLALSRSRYGADVPDWDLALTTLEVRGKLRARVPEWYALPSLKYPLRLSGEQCSSSETARYKASVAVAAIRQGLHDEIASASLRPLPFPPGTGLSLLCGRGWPQISACEPCRIADLTGGLGVDSWAFSQVFGEVLYNEMRPELADAARWNFKQLGISNITVSNRALSPGNVNEILNGFKADILFLDPARRASDGRKVFRLEDCEPDVSELLPELLAAAPLLLLKLSPMADISLLCKQLGCVKEVHVVAAEGECKELLLLLERGYEGAVRLVACESGAAAEIPEEDPALLSGWGRPEEGAYLFEPGKALLKAGAFTFPCRFGLKKLERHTHLYVAPGPVPELEPFGKWLPILAWMPFNKQTVKDLSSRIGPAEIIARNFPLSSEDLRKKLKLPEGTSARIYAAKTLEGKSLIICKL